MKQEKTIMDREGIDRALARLTHEIVERNHGVEGLAVIGIRTGGAHLARRIKEKIDRIEHTSVPLGIIDITLYRDDLFLSLDQPIVESTEIPFSIVDMHVILVDDVLFTGRTIRAAMDALMDLGRPRTIQLVILVDRGHRELPTRPDYLGKEISTTRDEDVDVMLSEEGNTDKVVVTTRSMERRG